MSVVLSDVQGNDLKLELVEKGMVNNDLEGELCQRERTANRTVPVLYLSRSKYQMKSETN